MTDTYTAETEQENGSRKIALFEYVFVLILILYAGKANRIFSSQSLTENPVGFLLPVILSVILAFRWKIVYEYRFYLLIFFFTGYFLAVSIKYREIQPTFLIFYFTLFFVVYTTIRSLKFNLFQIFEYLIFWMAIFCLFMWMVQIALGGDTLLNLFSNISFLKSNSYVTGDGVNAIFYSVQPSEKALLLGITIPRNSGYAWEPGAFAVFLCLAIYINLFSNIQDENSRKRFVVLLAALFSTQSTTGYVIFLLIISFYLVNRYLQKVLLFLPVLVVMLILISSLPFMKDKIIEYIDETNRVDDIVEISIGRENAVNPQRFSSFRIAFIDFLDNPVFGLAAHREETWTYKIGANVSPISGIGNLMAQFGIVGTIFFFILTLKSSFLFSRVFIYKGRLLLFLVVILISISYTLIFLPLIMCFWMMALFEQPEAETSGKIAENQNVKLDNPSY